MWKKKCGRKKVEERRLEERMWKTESGRKKVEEGKWRKESGRKKVEEKRSGKKKIESNLISLHLLNQRTFNLILLCLNYLLYYEGRLTGLTKNWK